jgi:hypothetical protein
MCSDKASLRISGSSAGCFDGTAGAVAWFGALWFDKTPGTQSIVTGTAKIIDSNVAATGAVHLQKKGAVRATGQHASAFTEGGVLFRQIAFVANARENGHVSLFH